MKECLIMKNFVLEGKIFIGMIARRCKISSIQPESLRPEKNFATVRGIFTL
jgi:hypothetical protein